MGKKARKVRFVDKSEIMVAPLKPERLKTYFYTLELSFDRIPIKRNISYKTGAWKKRKQ